MDNNFIAGFYCGEGWMCKQNVSGKYWSWQIGFDMHIRDIWILQEIQKQFGGHLRIKKNQVHCQLRITKTNEIRKWITDITPLLVGYKKQQMDSWIKEFNVYKGELGNIAYK